jgi:hypothetical protein
LVRALSVGFFLVSCYFVWRSFYRMRIHGNKRIVYHTT